MSRAVSESRPPSELAPGRRAPLRRVGVVVHPTRDVETPLTALREWTAEHGATLLEVPFPGLEPRLDLESTEEACDLLVAMGGDGTTLAAIRAAGGAGRPVLGVACGSLGALTSVPAERIGEALGQIAAGDWESRAVPALRVRPAEGEELLAYNDVVVVRRGEGQVRVSMSVDGALYTRLAGDGVIVATPAGSSAYTLAARGPLLLPDLGAFVVTALPTHGGFSPPLVLTAEATLTLEIGASHGGARLELDGREADGPSERLEITMVREAAEVVAFTDQVSHLTGLRERGILTDSPRILADEQRAAEGR